MMTGDEKKYLRKQPQLKQVEQQKYSELNQLKEIHSKCVELNKLPSKLKVNKFIENSKLSISKISTKIEIDVEQSKVNFSQQQIHLNEIKQKMEQVEKQLNELKPLQIE